MPTTHPLKPVRSQCTCPAPSVGFASLLSRYLPARLPGAPFPIPGLCPVPCRACARGFQRSRPCCTVLCVASPLPLLSPLAWRQVSDTEPCLYVCFFFSGGVKGLLVCFAVLCVCACVRLCACRWARVFVGACTSTLCACVCMCVSRAPAMRAGSGVFLTPTLAAAKCGMGGKPLN